MIRSYSDKTLKVLWGLSQGRCTHPDCPQACIVPNADENDFTILCEISHIYADGKNDPRGNPHGLSQDELNHHSNLIVLCSIHHTIVDDPANASVFTAELLFEWKAIQVAWVIAETAKYMPDVTFKELTMVTEAILTNPVQPTLRFEVTAPLEKMHKNDLGEDSLRLMQQGYAKAPEVDEFVRHRALYDPQFPERLKAGFVAEYDRLYAMGIYGDALFTLLHQFTYRKQDDFMVRAAGLAVLVYLFQKCEIFEP